MKNPVLASYGQAMSFQFPFSLSKLIKRLNYWRSARATIAQLNQLSDHQLQDIGINRSDIPKTAATVAANAFNH